MITTTISAFFVIYLFCLAGLFSYEFKDNWFQHFGLLGGGITSVAAMYRVYNMGWVPTEMLVFAVSVALYALGTALKVWGFRKKRYECTTQS